MDAFRLRLGDTDWSLSDISDSALGGSRREHGNLSIDLIDIARCEAKKEMRIEGVE